MLLFSGCQIKEFIMPTWDVQLNVPLMNDTFYVSDLIDSVNFFPAPDNNIVFQTSGEIESDTASEMTWTSNTTVQSIQLPSQGTVNGSISMGNSQSGLQIAYAMIEQGLIQYSFSGMQSSVNTVLVTFGDIRNSDNNPLTIYYTGRNNRLVKDLAGYHIGQAGSDSLITDLSFSIQVDSGLPDGSPAGTLEIQFPTTLRFSTIRGRFSDLRMNIRQNMSQIDIDYPGNIDQAVNVTDTRINIRITNPSSFPFWLMGEYFAVNENTGATRVVDTFDSEGNPYEINPAAGSNPGITEIQFADSVDYLLEIMPTHIELRNAYFRISNISGMIGEISSSDIITGEYTATAPFRFILFNEPVTPRDPVVINITSDNIDLIRRNVMTAGMSLAILNQLEVGAEVTMYFGNTEELDPDIPATWVFSKTSHLQAGGQGAQEQLIDFNLTDHEVQFFTEPVVYMQMVFRFDATDGPVTITASQNDFIRIRSMVSVSAYVED
jgi:hypothetical protein